MSLGHGSSIVRDGLVLHLDAANVKSYPGFQARTDRWYDITKNYPAASIIGNETTITHTNGYFDHSPGGAYFGASGSNSVGSEEDAAYWRMSANPNVVSPNTTKQWTVLGFANFNGGQSGNGGGWFHKIGVGDERGIHIEPINNNLRINGASGWSNPQINISAYHNQFACYAVTYATTGTYGTDVGTLKVYINGNIVATNASFIPVVDDTNSQIWLGRRNGHLRHFTDGQLANYLYYVKELNESEIKQNFEALRGRYSI